MPNIRQLYIFRSLEWKHYHHDKNDLVQEIKKTGMSINIHVYPPTDNVLDSKFVKVLNVDFEETTTSLMDSFPVKEIATVIFNETMAKEFATSSISLDKSEKKVPSRGKRTVPKAASPFGKATTVKETSKVKTGSSVRIATSPKKKSRIKRQQYHKDVGFTSGHCLIGKDDLGVSKSVSKPATDDVHVKAMVALLALLKEQVFSDLQETIYFDTVHTERRSGFAGKIHPEMYSKPFGQL
jgi:hypothetical protein